MVRARQRKRIRAAVRDQHLETFVLRQINHDARIMRVVFDDQDHAVVLREVVAVIDYLLDWPLSQTGLRERAVAGRLCAVCGRRGSQ